MPGNRNYCGTVYAPEGEELRMFDCELWPDYVSYCVYQLEMCPDTGRLHFQLYLELSAQKTMVQLRAELDGLENTWLKPRRGTQHQARVYCMKEDSRLEGPWEYGTLKNQGARADLEAVKTDIDKGMPMRQIVDEHFHTCARYMNFFRSYKRMREPQRDWVMEIYIILGPSGTGKTRFARDAFPGAYWKPHGKWWDNYDGHDVVVVDEMYGNRFSFTELLNLMDRYPHSVEIKGGTVEFTSKTLVFTSNQLPEDWYDPQRTHQHMRWEENPLKRRIDEFAQIINLGAIITAPRLAIIGPVIDGQPRLGGI